MFTHQTVVLQTYAQLRMTTADPSRNRSGQVFFNDWLCIQIAVQAVQTCNKVCYVPLVKRCAGGACLWPDSCCLSFQLPTCSAAVEDKRASCHSLKLLLRVCCQACNTASAELQHKIKHQLAMLCKQCSPAHCSPCLPATATDCCLISAVLCCCAEQHHCTRLLLCKQVPTCSQMHKDSHCTRQNDYTY